jgi:2-C-methyl-D-erythritol 2,4-cyclodiphosphate synthase
MPLRVGIGYDSHRLVEGERLVIGGVEIEHDRGLAGHSDADVLTHAVIDALLGAAALGDIGQHFPDTDPQYEGCSSIELLEKVVGLLADRSYAIVNVDATIVMERPQIAPFRHQMRLSISATLGIGIERVSVKATRGEGIGFVGRGEGAACMAIATVEQ